MRNLLLTSTLFIAAFAPLAANATPVGFDAVADFSISNGNPNGVWTYGYGTPGSTFTAYNVPGASWNGSSINYYASNPNGIPAVGHNTTGLNVGTIAPPTDVLWLHPGDANDLASIVEFTALTAGKFDFQGLFERVDLYNGAGNGVGVTIYQGNSVLVGRRVIPTTTYLNGVSFNTVATLSAGETVSFVVDRNGLEDGPNTNDYYFDSTGLKLSVAATPEPSSLLLFGTGIVGVACVARRKKFFTV